MARTLPLSSARGCWALQLQSSRPPILFCGFRRGIAGFDSQNNERPSKNHRCLMKLLNRKGHPHPCHVRTRRSNGGDAPSASAEGRPVRRAQQTALWIALAAYVIWLFLLPFAPGDPVWAIKSETINDLLGLSLNFFFILPLLNFVGIHVIEAPVLHPVSEGLFNFVIAWTFLFAPLLFTDCQRGRYKGSLELLWGFQMFLTNTFLIPYMAIRLNDMDTEHPPPEPSSLGILMTGGAPIVSLIGGVICFTSIVWAFFGRLNGGFGGFTDRWDYLISYIGSERLAYAFIWDIGLYAIFQTWLIGDNLQNVKEGNVGLVNSLRFIPVAGLVAYLLCLDDEKEH